MKFELCLLFFFFNISGNFFSDFFLKAIIIVATIFSFVEHAKKQAAARFDRKPQADIDQLLSYIQQT